MTWRAVTYKTFAICFLYRDCVCAENKFDSDDDLPLSEWFSKTI